MATESASYKACMVRVYRRRYEQPAQFGKTSALAKFEEIVDETNDMNDMRDLYNSCFTLGENVKVIDIYDEMESSEEESSDDNVHHVEKDRETVAQMMLSMAQKNRIKSERKQKHHQKRKAFWKAILSPFKHSWRFITGKRH